MFKGFKCFQQQVLEMWDRKSTKEMLNKYFIDFRNSSPKGLKGVSIALDHFALSHQKF